MKILPKLNYSVDGYGSLDKDKIYYAIEATNQDNWKQEGKIFVQPNDDLPIELLLKHGDYEIITTDHLPENVQCALEWFDDNRDDFTDTDRIGFDALSNYILAK
jgi:hypothetical protein